jgi:hypothetical protein
MTGLYIAGYGFRSSEEVDISRACQEFDSALVFKRHPRTGDLTIFQRLEVGNSYRSHADAAELVDGELFPLKAFPHRIPSRDEVQKWLWESSSERGDLLEKVQRNNRKIREDQEKDVQAQIRERAVFLEHGFRMYGEDTGRSVSLPNDGKRRRTAG